MTLVLVYPVNRRRAIAPLDLKGLGTVVVFFPVMEKKALRVSRLAIKGILGLNPSMQGWSPPMGYPRSTRIPRLLILVTLLKTAHLFLVVTLAILFLSVGGITTPRNIVEALRILLSILLVPKILLIPVIGPNLYPPLPPTELILTFSVTKLLEVLSTTSKGSRTLLKTESTILGLSLMDNVLLAYLIILLGRTFVALLHIRTAVALFLSLTTLLTSPLPLISITLSTRVFSTLLVITIGLVTPTTPFLTTTQLLSF